MLQDIRENSQGMIAKVIIGFIVAIFALTGVEWLIGGFVASPPVELLTWPASAARFHPKALFLRPRPGALHGQCQCRHLHRLQEPRQVGVVEPSNPPVLLPAAAVDHHQY